MAGTGEDGGAIDSPERTADVAAVATAGSSLTMTADERSGENHPMKKTALFMSVLFLAASVPVVANAAVNVTGTGRITFLTSGFASNSMRVTLDTAFSNPEGCAVSDGFITDPADPGTPLYHSILLAAFLSGKPVSLIISGCFVSRPKIIGVSVTP
jgi:hypothetical protein